MRWMRERLNKDEGFTLIELMVVVLIIAVLVAIAIPSFLGFRNRAQDRSAQSDLRTVLLAEKGEWTDSGAYTTTEATLKSFDPGIQLSAEAVGDLTSDEPVGAYLSVAANDDAICLVKVSDSGAFFAIFDDATAGGGTYYNTGTSITCPTAAGAAPAGWTTGGW